MGARAGVRAFTLTKLQAAQIRGDHRDIRGRHTRHVPDDATAGWAPNSELPRTFRRVDPAVWTGHVSPFRWSRDTLCTLIYDL